TNSLKPRELTTPEKALFQRVNRLLKRQIHRAESQRKTQPGLTLKNQHQRTKPTTNDRPTLLHEPRKIKIETGISRRPNPKNQR
ncbi:hypothetical protein ACYTR9_23395, partial [Vibrio antiquarius]